MVEVCRQMGHVGGSSFMIASPQSPQTQQWPQGPNTCDLSRSMHTTHLSSASCSCIEEEVEAILFKGEMQATQAASRKCLQSTRVRALRLVVGGGW